MLIAWCRPFGLGGTESRTAPGWGQFESGFTDTAERAEEVLARSDDLANSARNLKVVCVETSFDNSLQRVADLSMHLTPRTLATELSKLSRSLPVLIHHLKPACVSKIHEEIRALDRPDLEYLE